MKCVIYLIMLFVLIRKRILCFNINDLKAADFGENELLKKTIELEEDKPKPFFGISMKWRIAANLVTFTEYTARLQFAYPIKIPFSIYYQDKLDEIKKQEMMEKEKEMMEEEKQKQMRGRREIRNERHGFFKHLEVISSHLGVSPRDCVLRAVCEVAETPFEEDTFLGDFLNLLFKASSVGNTESPDEDHSFNDYISAETHGHSLENCHEIYRNCSRSIFDFLPEDLHKVVYHDEGTEGSFM